VAVTRESVQTTHFIEPHFPILLYICGEMQIYKEFSFDSAHFLPNVPEGHKCKNMHGHTYRLKVVIEGEPDQHFGWIMDFKELKDALTPVIDQLDHKVINDIKGLENATAENITIWIWNQIKPVLPLLSRIELYETPTTGVIYSGQ
jgi:6-pyruvoyltetrahydropterin/6-carboxytetrahydropterin synthase